MSQPLAPWLIQSLLLHSNYTNPKPGCNLALSKAAVPISEQINSRNVWSYHSIGRALLFPFMQTYLGWQTSDLAGRAYCAWELF